MRFHHLSMTAFGPYAATETVDFDELNEAGIFLLTGPTGAGKTSILDAICFALYGVVPGVREVKTLRSHHAAEGVAPEVVLEATIGDQRYRVRRSPEWHRPKKRGDGTTREHACASLTVLEDDGTERLVSSRIAEVGHELTMAIGMSSEQFMQVVLLPQGDFQRFLQASSDERQAVLEKLFRTHRFTRIERWMHDRTRELGQRAAQAEKQVCQLLATIANRAGTALPDALAEDTLGDVGTAARAWTVDALAAARAQHAEAVLEERAAQEMLEAARLDEQRAEQLRTALERHTTARRVLESLAETEPQAAEDLSTLGRHDAALLVRPLLQPLAELQDCATTAAADRDEALLALPALPHDLQPTSSDRAGCSATARTVADRLARLRAALPRETALHRAGADMQTALGARDDLRHELDELSQLAEKLPEERDEVQRLLAENQLLAHGLDEARAALTRASDQHQAALRLPASRAVHDDLVVKHLDARERAATAREHHLEVVERRLTGMAAELAGQLTDDQPCQVCGSSVHPAPARHSAGAVTEQVQQLASDEADRLRTLVDGLAERVADSARSLQGLEAQASGLSAADAAANVDACRSAVAAAEAAVAAVAGLDERARTVEGLLESASERLTELREQIASRDAEITALRTTFEEAAREVADAVGAGGGTVEAAIRALERALAEIERAAAAFESHEAARTRATEALAHADAEAEKQGFVSAAEAAQALLDQDTVDVLRRGLETRDERRRAASAVLDGVPPDLDVDAAPDVAAAHALVVSATADWRRAGTRLGTIEQAVASLASLVDQLDLALTVWEPAREEHSTAQAMTKLVRGMGGDNQLQMRLSSYVLATRLDQVLEAANERLSHMRDQRYSLRRCGKTRGVGRAGLGLEVLDTWTGEARAPSTLSGGETFVVSLALALGLADVVSHEAGGTRVDTLFIDEGFGMLDAETLDDVMDRIDALRAGGRTVGVVSHVTELRGRIPTQVHVELGRSGSSVAVRTLVA